MWIVLLKLAKMNLNTFAALNISDQRGKSNAHSRSSVLLFGGCSCIQAFLHSLVCNIYLGFELFGSFSPHITRSVSVWVCRAAKKIPVFLNSIWFASLEIRKIKQTENKVQWWSPPTNTWVYVMQTHQELESSFWIYVPLILHFWIGLWLISRVLNPASFHPFFYTPPHQLNQSIEVDVVRLSLFMSVNRYLKTVQPHNSTLWLIFLKCFFQRFCLHFHSLSLSISFFFSFSIHFDFCFIFSHLVDVCVPCTRRACVVFIAYIAV